MVAAASLGTVTRRLPVNARAFIDLFEVLHIRRTIGRCDTSRDAGRLRTPPALPT
jgi:hypothetical protein